MRETQIEHRLKKLEEHLKTEEGEGNDILYDVVQSFRQLDKIAYKLGFLSEQQSYATRLSWWPMISVLGLYSAGKSTFINHYVGQDLQRTGTQAIDDKFTVICFSGDKKVNTLPGIALDADPRFPFYQISHDIADITKSTGQKVDTYLQLKTCPSEQLCGKILIDSPGFDADSQRSSTLQVSQYIIDLSDLVLVFFDARHPEPGAMRDTLEHLVTEAVIRPDSNKFLYILNQMDVTTKDDTQEEVVAAWQRSLAQAGLTAGRFYRIYNPNACESSLSEPVKERLEKKCQMDLKEIHARMEQVGRERAYRVIGMLEHTIKDLEHKIVPQLSDLLQRWKKRVFWSEVILDGFLVVLIGAWFSMTNMQISDYINWQNPISLGMGLGILILGGIFVHLKICKSSAKHILAQLQLEIKDEYTREGLTRAFRKNTGTFRSLFIWLISEPVGWSRKTQLRLHNILTNINTYVQQLNDRFTNPSGKKNQSPPAVTVKSEEKKPAPPTKV